MSDYSTLLESWGATGSSYPNGYSYLEGEQPVDDWDNFFANNTIEDIHHLISLTNKRVETGSGTSFPSSPDTSHAFYRSDNERLYTYNSTSSEWNGLLKVDGDTLQGDLDLGGNNLKGIGSLSLTGDTDLDGNDLKDTASGKLLYDASSGHIPLDALESSTVTVNSGAHLSGGGSISLGGSLTVDVDDDFLLNDGDRLTGELVGERPGSSRVFTARDSSSGDRLSLRVSGSNTFQFVGYDSSDGAWDYNSALSYDPGTAKWKFGSLPSVNGNNIATQTWANNNADVPNADYADSAGDANTLDGHDSTYFADDSDFANHSSDSDAHHTRVTFDKISRSKNISPGEDKTFYSLSNISSFSSGDWLDSCSFKNKHTSDASAFIEVFYGDGSSEIMSPWVIEVREFGSAELNKEGTYVSGVDLNGFNNGSGSVNISWDVSWAN